MKTQHRFHASPEIITKIVNRIVDSVHPQKIILFGSYARGTEGPNSDLDLMIIEPKNLKLHHSRREELRKIGQALRGILIPKDVLVYSQDEVKQWENTPSHIVGIALKEGETLYEKK